MRGFAETHASGVVAAPSWTEQNNAGLRPRSTHVKHERVDIKGLVDSVGVVVGGYGKGLCKRRDRGIEPSSALT